MLHSRTGHIRQYDLSLLHAG